MKLKLSEIRPGDQIIGLGRFEYFVMWVGEVIHPKGNYVTPFVVDYLGGIGPLGPFGWEHEFRVVRAQ